MILDRFVIAMIVFLNIIKYVQDKWSAVGLV